MPELASNATVHSRSREPGGQFTVCVQVTEAGRVRVEVVDEGGPWTQPVCGDGQHGRGLLIVSQLARDWGRAGDAATGWTVWVEMDNS